MLSPSFGADRLVSISPSRWLCLWIGFAATAAVTLCIIYLPVWGAIIASALCMGAAAYLVRRDALLLAPQSIVALRLGQFGMDYQLSNGTWQKGEVLQSSYVSRWLSVVTLRCPAFPYRRYIILMPDSLSADVARRVRARLRWWQSRQTSDSAR